MTTNKYRPSSDVDAGEWTPSFGEDLYAMVNEEVADDDSFITSSEAIDDVCEFGFANIATPAVRTDHAVTYRIKSVGDAAATVELREGSRIIAEFEHSPVPADWTTYDQALSEAIAGTISVYAALTLRLRKGHPMIGYKFVKADFGAVGDGAADDTDA